VGVAIGPGSFTGLRVGLAAAKGLALAQGLALIGIPTLDVTAYPHQAQPIPVIAVAQAGRGRVYWAPYAHGPSGWGPQEPYALSTAAEIANAVVRATAFAGELTDADRETLARFAGRQRTVFLSPALGMRRAGVLAELALKRLELGHVDDPATLSPIYLQQPDGAKAAGPTGGNRAIGGVP
jgi:tRNA threonylcarbamoyladenosine biosynthesis protein TsaB